MKVKITECKGKGSWYRNCIGQAYGVKDDMFESGQKKLYIVTSGLVPLEDAPNEDCEQLLIEEDECEIIVEYPKCIGCWWDICFDTNCKLKVECMTKSISKNFPNCFGDVNSCEKANECNRVEACYQHYICRS